MLSWRHFRTSSELLLMRLTGDVKIWNFSVKHKLRLLDLFWYGLVWSITDQCMIGFLIPFLFISQKCLDNSVEFALPSYLEELHYLWNRSLNVFSARETMSMYKQCPSRGQVSFCWQLCLGWSLFSLDRILLLCNFIMLAKLGKQP